MKKTFLFLVFTTLFLSCSEDSSEKEVPQPEAKEETEEIFDLLNFDLEVEVFEDGGIMLEASATNIDDAEVTEHGFLLSQFENPDFNNSQKFESDEIQGKKFLLTIDKDLDFNKEYFIVAYVKIGETYEYTSIKSFVSTGSKAPIIGQIDQAHIGDTLRIKGSNFSSISNKIKVLFDEEVGSVLESSDTLVKCIVPETLKRFNPKITLELYNKSDSFEDFSLFTPIIENISQEMVSIGDTLTVYGKHFDFENNRNTIIIEEKQSEILFSSKDSITFVLPQSLSKSTNSLKLITQLQEVSSGVSFAINAPIIEQAPSSFYANETIEIVGDEFSPILEDNIVWFDDNRAEILAASKNKLTVKVPIGPYEDRNPMLRMELMDQEFQYSEELTLIDVWLFYKELDYNSYYQNFVNKDNIAYIFEEDDHNARFSVKRLDSELNILSTFYVDYPRTSMKDEYYSILYNAESDRVFFYFAEEEEHNFYEFLPNSQTFVERAEYPDTARKSPTVFNIENLVYLGLGRYPETNYYPEYELFSHFWSYDDSEDTWNPIANFLGNSNRLLTSTFVIDNEAYVGNGATSTGHYDFWKFNPVSDEWIRIANFPDIRNNTTAFEYNGNGYVFFGGFLSSSDGEFKYVPSLDDWIELERQNETQFQYHGASAPTSNIKFSNAIYLLVRQSNGRCYKADLQRL
ncbi:IPT/TIG domain-containing protein [Maribacter sp. 2304DJ31-5]|uniref:IPT/TIG domain-containing protein n=1 Tax=Maribacter sp. 2304DJ31-5 TaxID=3386273 RepID=UPI0039BC4C7F